MCSMGLRSRLRAGHGNVRIPTSLRYSVTMGVTGALALSCIKKKLWHGNKWGLYSIYGITWSLKTVRHLRYSYRKQRGRCELHKKYHPRSLLTHLDNQQFPLLHVVQNAHLCFSKLADILLFLLKHAAFVREQNIIPFRHCPISVQR